MSNETSGYEPPKTENFKFFSHRQCEYFHCLFCYCPLYALGEDCGGNFTYYKGVKDCTDCLIPHSRNAYDYITSRFGELVVLAQEKEPVDSPEKI